ncbi:MAG: Gfo/Idh/MocA family oxidoreductase [Anaerolineae bacterium]|nr:Gfo/Idh/MocA family oxidoreductase [Anaerolineae bacterium]
MTEKIRWGILGTGNIAKKFATGLSVLPDAELVAVGSRAQDTADEFGAEFDVPHRHDSYAALANDPDVDVVYVATPHTFHCANTLLCLDAGKPVLCEKPFAINATEAQLMIAAARARKLFLMDAIWTRFLPTLVKVREWLAAGEIGEVRMLHADFGFRAEYNPEGRLFNPALGGGALLDVGIYTVQLASLVFGRPPSQIASLATMGKTGVDEQGAIILGYADGCMAQLTCATRLTTHHEASIFGTAGRIRLHTPWWRGTGVSLFHRPILVADIALDLPHISNGYEYEAAEVMSCLRGGRQESAIMPLDETLSIMHTLDAIREQWGLKYPME